ncbi:MAG TPA: hypothetical protein VIQ74_05980 [Gemmatimonadaceae bacterium]
MRPIMLIPTSLLLGAALTSCARNSDPRTDSESVTPADTAPASQPAAGPTSAEQQRLTGKIVNSGTARFLITTLQIEGRKPIRLVGALESELRHLSGATVRVLGSSAPTGIVDTLDVVEYEVLSINGQRPHVGTVFLRDGGIWLAASDTLSDTVRLVPEIAALREHAGFKVWIIGSGAAEGGEIHVESYGVIGPVK